MNKEIKAIILIVLIVLVALISTSIYILFNSLVDSDRKVNQSPNNQQVNNATALIFEVSTDKSIYEVNETIMIQLKITNPTDFEITLDFSSSYQFDYTISSEQGQVYRWSKDKGFLDVLTYLKIPAHDSHIKIFYHIPEDYPLESGIYTIEGIVVEYFTDTTQIEIEQENNATARDLIFMFSTDGQSYDVNETIMILLRLINPTDSLITLDFSSGYQFDYTITSAKGQLYRWSDDKAFIQMLTNIKINPHDSYTRTFNHTPEDYPLLPGSYSIEGVVVGYFTERTTIEIS